METNARPRRWLRGGLVCLGALVISTLGIQASDIAGGISGRFVGSVVDSGGPCGQHAVFERFGPYALCVDIYEAAAGPSCIYKVPGNEVETEANVLTSSCKAISEPGRDVWRHVTYTQAQQLCARSGKRLPTASEWHRIALSMGSISACALTGDGPRPTGSSGCVTFSGVYDMVGNVWEWVNDTVTDGQLAGRYVPQSGYVKLVDDAGLVLRTSDLPVEAFGNDYAWTDQVGVRGILRGGFYQSGDDGGVFSQNLAVPLEFQAVGVGFRCVRDVE